MLLWASAKLTGLLTPAQQSAISAAILAQQRPDGGFSMSSLVGSWKRKDGTPLEAASDGYATGLIAFVLEQVNAPESQPARADASDCLAADELARGRPLGGGVAEQAAGAFLGGRTLHERRGHGLRGSRAEQRIEAIIARLTPAIPA